MKIKESETIPKKEKIGFMDWVVTDPQAFHIVLKWGSLITGGWVGVLSGTFFYSKMWGFGIFFAIISGSLFLRFYKVHKLQKAGMNLDLTIGDIAENVTGGKLKYNGRIEQQSNGDVAGETEQVNKGSDETTGRDTETIKRDVDSTSVCCEGNKKN